MRTLAAIRRQPLALAGATILLVVVLAALVGPLLVSSGPHARVGQPFGAPSAAHPLGLDDAGVDVLSQLLSGARVSLFIGGAAAFVAMLVGGTVGLLAGYWGGRTETALMAVTNYFSVIPDIALIIVAAALFGRSLTNIVLIIGLIYWTFTARVIRAQVKSVRERGFVVRARALGATNTRIVLSHVLPQVLPLLIAQTALFMGYAIFAETAISFLGLGDPDQVSWGTMIRNAFQANALSNGAWWAIVPPGVAIAVVILACTALATAVEDALNPRLAASHVSVRRFRVGRPEGT